MKKIVTLILMFLATWNILSAQTALSYQAVVRDADNNLVPNTAVSVTISVKNGETAVYTETHEVTTNLNGILSLMIGQGTPVGEGSIDDVDWSNANIETDFTFTLPETQEQVEVTDNTPVMAVPYALQAGKTELTTNMIVDYLSSDETSFEDIVTIMQALVDNPEGVKDDVKDTVINYIKAHKDIAKEVAFSYLASLDAADMLWLYNAVGTNQSVKDTIKKIVVNFVINNKDLAMETLAGYAEEITAEDVDELYTALAGMPTAVKDTIKKKILTFAQQHRYDIVAPLVAHFLTTATGTEVSLAIALFEANQHGLKEAIIDGLFYTYLGEYLQAHPEAGVSGVTQEQINTIVGNAVEEAGYLENPADCEVDICDMKEAVDELKSGN